ncbi:MAG TPA: hypothetical protein PK191_08415 [Niabella sp.]|nr:hypothetical protein [Niabella sp.]HOZ95645.1 hypothetical protein [Niabella sp.]HQW13885.1 hypothetical protein [Niabella sp.]HQX19222.1 hypothetical protein [Niabella sp.]HQX42246.1 hypothetical protein [Niabella sp.]
MNALKLVIIIGVFGIMAIAGLYTFRYLNKLLMNSQGIFRIIFFALLLFAAMGGIYFGGFVAMGLMIDYLSN